MKKKSFVTFMYTTKWGQEILNGILHSNVLCLAAVFMRCKLSRFLIPNYIEEGKTSLVIAIGCTGGKHRSVVLAEELFSRLGTAEGYGLRIEHRDIAH